MFGKTGDYFETRRESDTLKNDFPLKTLGLTGKTAEKTPAEPGSAICQVWLDYMKTRKKSRIETENIICCPTLGKFKYSSRLQVNGNMQIQTKVKSIQTKK